MKCGPDTANNGLEELDGAVIVTNAAGEQWEESPALAILPALS